MSTGVSFGLRLDLYLQFLGAARQSINTQVHLPTPTPTPSSHNSYTHTQFPSYITSQNLPHNPRRLPIRAEQFLALLSLLLDPIVLIQQIAEQIFPVQLAHESILDLVAAVVDEQVHDCFGDLVGDGLAHDVEVRGNEAADEFGLEGFAVGQGGLGGLFGLWRVLLVGWCEGLGKGGTLTNSASPNSELW